MSNATCASVALSESPLAAKLSLVATCAVTLPILAVFTKGVHDKMEISHPVFTLAFQEAVVLCVAQAGMLVLLIPLSLDPDEIWLAFYSGLSYLALQFHQLSWLGITALRL